MLKCSCRFAALATWLGERAAAEKGPLELWACVACSGAHAPVIGLAAACSVSTGLAAAVPVCQSLMQGKKCFACVCASVGSCNGLAISFWCMPLELSWETRARVDPCHILLLERAWATLSLAMPMKLWDSAGRECGGTPLYLHAYIHTDHFLYRSIFILSCFFLMFFCTSDALHFTSRQDNFE